MIPTFAPAKPRETFTAVRNGRCCVQALRRDGYRYTMLSCTTPDRGFGTRLTVDHIISASVTGDSGQTSCRAAARRPAHRPAGNFAKFKNFFSSPRLDGRLIKRRLCRSVGFACINLTRPSNPRWALEPSKTGRLGFRSLSLEGKTRKYLLDFDFQRSPRGRRLAPLRCSLPQCQLHWLDCTRSAACRPALNLRICR